jgi:putative DNA primase/helicase
VKAWTGGDTISVRPLYRNSFSFQPTHKLWLAFNHKPNIRDDSLAMWRRIRLIPFLRTFNRQQADEKLPEKLKAEAPGILNWAVAGCLAWQQEGLEPPATVEQATREYQAESDLLGAFLEQYCELDATFRVPKGELRDGYQQWCKANRERPVSRNAFADRLKSRGFGEGNDGSVRYWTGLRWKTEPGAVPFAG